MTSKNRWLPALVLTALSAATAPAAANEIGTARLQIAGTRLIVSPASQTVPFDTPTIVDTELAGYDAELGVLPADLRVLGDFAGPEVDGVLTLQTVPNEPFRIPALRLQGDYTLSNIRIVQGEEILAYGEPREAGVSVTQVLLTRVSSRPLTLDEIRALGLPIDESSFSGYNLTFGFGVAGEVIEYNMPLVRLAFGPEVEWLPEEQIVHLPDFTRTGGTVRTSRFKPPRMIPFTFGYGTPQGPKIPAGGCDPSGECRPTEPPHTPLVGVILFPTDLSLLHQYFSVVLMVQNGAPEGDVLEVRDLLAKILLPTGLKLHETNPPTILGQPVHVRDKGPDGEVGTADDVSVIIAQAAGDAEYLVEGVREGTHVVHFELEGTLHGLPSGPQRVAGEAQGAVVVRDPYFSVRVSHPETVRNDIEYSMFMTVTNIGNIPANLVSLKLPAYAMSGVRVADGETDSKSIETLNPGDSETVEFRLLALRSGRVVSTSLRAPSIVDPAIEYSVEVGESGALSGDTLSLPRASDSMPREILRPALGLIGLGYSLAEAPPALASGLPRVRMAAVNERIYRLAEAGRHYRFGEDLFDVAAMMASEWNGARDQEWNWDELRRTTKKGGQLAAGVSDILTQESSSALEAFERFAATTHYLGQQAVLAAGAGVTLEVTSRTSGKAVAGAGDDAARIRSLPFAELFDLHSATVSAGEMVLLSDPEDGGYEARVRHPAGGPAELDLLLPDPAAVPGDPLRVVRFASFDLTAGGSAVVAFAADDTAWTLDVDSDGDGVAESQVAGVADSVAPRPFAVVAAVQNSDIDVTGHVVDVVFTEDVDLESLYPSDPDRFQLPGNRSNGGMVQAEEDVVGSLLSGYETVENPLSGLTNPRIVRVAFDNPISPYAAAPVLTVSDLASAYGQALAPAAVPVTLDAPQPGSLVRGKVFGADGEVVPGVSVALIESDLLGEGFEIRCFKHITASVVTDANGEFLFDYVRGGGECGDLFTVKAQDPATGAFGSATGRVRFAGAEQQLNILMPRRGSIRGQVRYDDGTVPESIRVIAANQDLNGGGKIAHVDADGSYDVDGVIVGTVALSADDGLGHFAYKTIELPQAGAVVEQDLIVVRRSEDDPPGSLRGTVRSATTSEPIGDAYVALYLGEVLLDVKRSGRDGRFDFGLVPSGVASVEVFSGGSFVTGAAAATYHVEIRPDRTEELDVLLREDVSAVEGHVYSRHWSGTLTPMAGAVVWIDGTPFHTVTDAAGFYRIDDVFIGDWKVRAASTTRGARADVTVTSGGATVLRDLYIDEPLPLGGIIGEVIGYDGQPQKGALIHLSGGYLSTRWHHATTTDDNGRFAIEGLGPGKYGVHAIGSGGGLGWAEIRYPGDTAWVTVKYRKGLIRIQTLEKDPVSGDTHPVVSQIAYRKTEVVSEWQLVVLGRDWVYENTDPTTGVLEIEALAGPYQFRTWNSFHDTQSGSGQIDYDGQVVEHTVVYEPTGVIRGTVFDTDGVTPAEGATVNLRGGSIAAYDVQTDPAGSFEFPLIPPGSYWLEVFYEDGAIFRQEHSRVSVSQPGQEVDVEINLPEQGSLVGWVETFDGDPVPGAVVSIYEGHYPYRRTTLNADGEGNFALHNVFVGSVYISAQAPELGGLGGRDWFEVTSEGEEVAAAITLEPVGEVVGTVTRPDTQTAVENASIRLANSGIFDAANSDAEGGYRFRLLPLGWYQIEAWDPESGRKGRSDWVQVVEHNYVAVADVELETRGIIDGTFTDGDTGLPLPGAVVRLLAAYRYWTYATTDENGYFEFAGIPEGDSRLYAVEIGGRRFVQQYVTLAAEDERVTVSLELAPTSVVTGSILNPLGMADGLFASSVNVWVEQGGQVVGAGFDNPYTFAGLVAWSPFRVIAQENGTPRQARATGNIREPGQSVDVDLRMQALGSLTVTVADSFGNPVPGADVYVSNGHDYGRETFAASADSSSSVSFADVREGNLWARAIDPLTSLRGSVTGSLVSEGENVVLNVTLQDTGTIRGRVVRADGVTPAAFAEVVVQSGGKWYFGEADEQGYFSFSSVPLGSYKLVVREKDGFGLMERYSALTANGEIHDYGVLVLDEVPPRVESITPPEGERDLPLATTVKIVFSEPIDTGRIGVNSVRLRERSGAAVTTTDQWNGEATELTLVPAGGLASGTLYDVFVAQEVYDLAGRSLAWRVRSSFYTADVIPPTVIDSLPRHGDAQVPVDTLITVTFSEPIDELSLAGAAIQLSDLTAGKGITTTVQLRPGGREIIVTPQIDPADPDFCGTELCPDRDVQLTVQGVRDEAGNVMAEAVSIVFWTPDETLPELTWLTPAAGEPFTSGDSVAITVDATDNRGVARLDFTLGEWSSTDVDSPYGWTVPAPVVDVVSDLVITAVVTDIFGNQQTFTRTISVAPRNNASPPQIASACPMEGDLVAPGVEIPIPYALTDDESIESFWLEVDGVRLEVTTPYDQAAASGTYDWTPPAGAVAGQVFDLRLGARDFAGNVAEHVVALAVPTGMILTGDQTVDASALAGQSLAVAAGEVVADGALDLSDLSILRDGTLASAAELLDLRVSGRTHVQCGAAIAVDGRGYLGGWTGHPTGYGPDGIAASAPNSGATHGGFGQQDGSAAVGEVYGSVRWPLEAGAGGPNALRGAPDDTNAGGGVLAFDVAELVVDGEIRARGVSAGAQGGGAGGSALIVADSLSGVGTIDVNGAQRGVIIAGGYNWYPAGGGGRLALYVDDLSGFDVRGQAASHGGYQAAGPGTVFVHTSGSTNGSLYLDAGEVDPLLSVPPIELPSLGGGNVVAAAASSDGLDLWVTVDVALRERWLGAHMQLFDAAGAELGTYAVAELDPAAGRARLEGAAGVVGAATFEGRYLFDEIVFGRGADLIANDPVIASTLVIEEDSAIDGELAAENLTVAAGAHLRPLAGGVLRFAVSGRMEVQAGAVIEANGAGYYGGWQGHPDGFGPAGVATSAPISGASHGGFGQQDLSAAVGETYGSVVWPRLGGGGGGNDTRSVPDNASNAGGGVLVLEVGGELVLDGELQAKGKTSGAEGAGAGGSIFVDAGRLSGTGRIVADGGPRGADIFAVEKYPAGGGGRVALHVDDLTAFDVLGQVQAYGGYDSAGPGTIYVRSAGATYGDLIVAAPPDLSDPSVLPTTALPALGAVSLIATASEGSDLRVTADAPLLARWHGAWMHLYDAAGASLGSFEVLEVDAGQALLAGAAAAAGAASGSGEYRFDEIQLRNGATLDTQDPVLGEDLVFATDAVLTDAVVEVENFRILAGVRVSSTAGQSLSLRVTGTLEIEAGASLDLTGLGYAAGQAPPWMTGAENVAGGSHGGDGSADVGSPGGIYDSVYEPSEAGGGGGYGGKRGGGALFLDVGELVVDGSILVRGEPGSAGAVGGAGGTVLVVADVVRGSGLIDAGGSEGCGHAGGGGRIAFWVGSLVGFDPATQALAHGGGSDCVPPDEHGGAGTVFVHTPASTYGDLRVDNGVATGGAARVGPATYLPALGSGASTALDADGADAWLAAATPFVARWRGAYAALLDAAGAELGEYRVADVDAAGRLRLEGAAAVAGAGVAAYEGRYRFDAVAVANGGDLGASDPVFQDSLVVAGGAGDVELAGVLEADTLTVPAGVTVRPSAGFDRIRWRVGTLTVEAGGAIDVSGLGYAGGPKGGFGEAPAGVVGSTSNAGGSHGGLGHHTGSQNAPGEIYGSVYQPRLGGGGGGSTTGTLWSWGSAGGGVVDIEATTLVVDGAVRADGLLVDAGGGAGGSVLIRAAELRGAGTIEARGAGPCARSGGGGRIALWIDAFDAFDPVAQTAAQGGGTDCVPPELYGGPGTIFVRTLASTYGDLRVDNGVDSSGAARVGPATYLPALGSGTVTALDADGADAWLTAAAPFAGRWQGAYAAVFDAAGSELGEARVAEIDAAGRLRLAGAAALAATGVTYEGRYRFDNVEVVGGGDLGAADPVLEGSLILAGGDIELHGDVEADSVTVRTGTTVRPAAGGDSFHWRVGTLTVEAGAVIDVSGLGYAGGPKGGFAAAPEGVVGSSSDAGGSHGGVGHIGKSQAVPGEIYGSVYQPRLGGAGGGSTSGTFWSWGSAGGGVFDLEATTLVLDGDIQASGRQIDAGGGAGGSVRILADELRGAGSVDARGAGPCDRSGGGGRVALHVGTFTGFDPLAQTRIGGGGTACATYGGPGTLLVRTATSTYGDLYVGHPDPGTAAETTPLPAIGQGTIGAVTVDAGDPSSAWIEPADPAVLFSVGVAGMWVRTGGVDYPVIGERPDRRAVLLAGAAGSVAVGDAYLGLYKLDTVTVAGGAHLEVLDGIETAVWNVDAQSTVETLDIEPPSATVTSPAEGALYAAGDPITFQVDATDNEAVTEVRFSFAGQSFADAAAPYEWTVNAPAVSESTDLVLAVEAVDAEDNVGVASRTVTVAPIPSGAPPTAAIVCPGAGALAAPGTGLDVSVAAADDHAVAKVELYLGGELAATLYEAPYAGRVEAPLTAVDGEVLELRAVAYDFAGQSAEATVDVSVAAGVAFTADATIGAGDASVDGQSVIVAGGVLTVDGVHAFRDLIVLDGATVTHPATTAGAAGALELTLDRHLYVACGGSIDADGRGYLGGYGYPNTLAEGAGNQIGGSHGGRGGNFDAGTAPAGRVYGSLFDPRDPGAGGGGAGATAGGGVIRILAVGDVTVDGTVTARGGGEGSAAAHGAGGAIRLDGATIRGRGAIDASGAGSTTSVAGGGGGRVALYAAAVDTGLLSRVSVTGGASSTAAGSGAAGTLFVKLDSQSFGELHVDNGAVISTQLTELLSVGTGVVSSADAGGFTDAAADFIHSLAGVEVAFNADLGQLWVITGHSHHGQSLALDTGQVALTAQAGDLYAGVYRFDRITVSGQAQALAEDQLSPVQAPEVEAGSELTASYAPTVTITQPAEGTVFYSGDDLAVAATVDDRFGVTSVTMSFNGETQNATSPPYAWTATAPVVTVPVDLPVTVEIVDLGGRRVDDVVTVTIQPSADPVAPVLTVADCPADQDLVVPGSAVAVAFSASDNELIASYTLLVDGQPADGATGVDQSQVAATLQWTVPAGAAPGTVYAVRVEARDYAGNVTAEERQLVVTTGSFLAGDQSLDATYGGQSLVLGGGVFTVTEPLTLASLTLAHGATVVGETKETLELTVNGEVSLICGTAIDVTGQGFERHETYPGETLPGTASGGSHLGVGGQYLTYAVGSTFGSVYRPQEPGGGSESLNVAWGRAGGGVVRLSATDVTLAAGSSIRANGAGFEAGDDPYARGGGGGSVWLSVSGTIGGSGTIEARGGDSGPNGRGSGGGGAIAVAYAASSGTVLDTLQARGGVSIPVGGAGTVYLLRPTSTYGDLVIDNDTSVGGRTILPSLGAGVAQAASGGAVLVTDLGSVPAYFVGHWVEVYDPTSGALKGTWRIASIDLATLTLDEGTGGPATVAPGDLWQGVYLFDNLTLAGDLKLESEDPLRVAATEEISGSLELRNVTAHDLVLRSGAVLTHPPTTDPAAPESLRIELSGDLTLETGAAIDVTGLGFERHETYPGETVPGTASGGSHLGVGGQYLTNAVGSTFGSVYRPQEPGGGSESTNIYGRAGGGVVRLSATDVTLAAGSSIRANGAGFEAGDDPYTRGGGGGSVWLSVSGTIGGGGTIEARGGDSGPNGRGSGGGGAIAVAYAASSGTVLDTLQARGGVSIQVGGAGTVYLLGPTSTYGDLVLDNGTVAGGRTILPSLGAGVAQAASGGDVLVTDLGSVPAYFAGHWVEVHDGASGALRGTWRIASVNGAALTLEEGAEGPVSILAGDVWQGVYRFDRLTLAGDHHLESEDPVRVATQEIAGTVELRQITAHDLVLRSGSVLTHPPTTDPTAPESLRIELTGNLTLEAGATIDVTGLGLERHQTYPGETLPGTASGGSHIGVGGQYLTNAVGSTFGSVYRPQEPGGGSESLNVAWGRAGGGVVRLSATDVTLAVGSSIRANGAGFEAGDDPYTRGGGGGSVWLSVSGTIGGGGTIEARGGDSGPNGRGSGGGGAIAVAYAASSGTVLDTLQARGGVSIPVGGAGTVYLSGPSSTFGDLVLDNGTAVGGHTVLPSLGVGAAQAGSGGGVLVTGLGSVSAFFVGHWVELFDAASGDLKGTWRIAAIDDGTLTLDPGAGGPIPVVPGDLWQGVYRFDNVTITGDHFFESEDPLRIAGTHEVIGTLETRKITSNDLVLRAGALVYHPPTTDPAAQESLRIELTGDLTLEAGAAIDVTGLGFERQETYPGETIPGNGSGGSHLGIGGQYLTNAVGSTFGSVYRPQEPGGGGQHSDPTLGRAGGGVVRVSAVNVTLAAGSAIRANGDGFVAGDHVWTRGGAGGSVWITAGGTIAGDGTIEARGGISGSSDIIGSGGGGAIAVEYGASSGTVLGNLQAWGGEVGVVGGAGTIYLVSPASTHGDLLVDNNGLSGQGDDLPALGSGTAAAGTAGSLLVTDLTADIPPFFVGHWVEVTAADATPKGTYRIAAVAGVTATLEAEGAEVISLAPGDLWRGVYRFDLVTVTGGASLTSADPVYESGLELDLVTSGQGEQR